MEPPVGVGRADAPGPRDLWRWFEPIHAVIYFAPECRTQLGATGLRGFWMGYFAARAAPLGPVGPAAVAATFFNFHPSMVRRSIPDAWVFAAPPVVLQARRTGAAAALRRILPSIDDHAPLAALLHRVVGSDSGSGRPLFSANRELEPSDDPTEALWQACTSLREHRGDGHVAALTCAGLDGCEALVLFAATEGIPASMFQESRGWSGDEWEHARRRLEDRGLMAGYRISPSGAELRRSIEERTDELAAPPFVALTSEEHHLVVDGLRLVADAVTTAGDVPFPNPIGLPAPART